MYSDLEEICWQGTHLEILFGLSIPGLFLIAFGMPFLGFYLIRRSRYKLEGLEAFSDPNIYLKQKVRNKLRLGFLTHGFLDKYYYWEIVLLLRKTILVLMMTFLAPISAGVQSLSAIILLIVFLL